MNNDFSGLVKHIDQKFEETNGRIDTLHQDFLNLQTSVDNYAKKADNYFKEMAVLLHKVNRLEEWVKKASAKLGIDFNV